MEGAALRLLGLKLVQHWQKPRDREEERELRQEVFL